MTTWQCPNGIDKLNSLSRADALLRKNYNYENCWKTKILYLDFTQFSWKSIIFELIKTKKPKMTDGRNGSEKHPTIENTSIKFCLRNLGHI